MKKLKYITPACIVVEMETEELLATSGEGPTGDAHGVGDSETDIAVESQGGGYNVWDD